jgi:membrane protease YdiL (CAAX protease family)
MTIWTKLAELNPKHFFLDTWQSSNEESAGLREIDRAQGKRLDLTPFYIFVLVAVIVTGQEYFGGRNNFRHLVDFINNVKNALSSPGWYKLVGWLQPYTKDLYAEDGYGSLGELGWWSLARIFGFVVIPVIFIMLVPGIRLKDCGLQFKGFFKHLWIYGILLLIVLPVVLAASYRADFLNYYPFYKDIQYPHGWADFLIWESMYFLQFCALEFFFRGFMIHPLKKALGAYTIFVMVVPYCMIHFGKPFPEVLAAIVAGIVLGTLSLKTKSIWCGVLIHITVALAMDTAALWQTGHWPGWQ